MQIVYIDYIRYLFIAIFKLHLQVTQKLHEKHHWL